MIPEYQTNPQPVNPKISPLNTPVTTSRGAKPKFPRIASTVPSAEEHRQNKSILWNGSTPRTAKTAPCQPVLAPSSLPITPSQPTLDPPCPPLVSIDDITGHKQAQVVERSRKRRKEHESLHDVARDVLGKADRISKCGRVLLDGMWSVRQEYNETTGQLGGKAHFSGLLRCSDRHCCPSCSPALAEHSKNELESALKVAKSLGLTVHMVVSTFSHHKKMPLKYSLSKFKRAKVIMREGRAYKDWYRSIGAVGTIKSFELTVNPETNGFHPHEHMLIFCRPNHMLPVASDVRPLWKKALLKVGLTCNDHGLRIDNAEQAGAYVAKGSWGTAHEMTYQHQKKGNRKGMTPPDLLRAYRETGSEEYADLYREFRENVKHTKALYWSRGLRELLRVGEEKPDDEILEEQVIGTRVVYRGTEREWKLLLRYSARADFLTFIETRGAERAGNFLRELRARGEP